MEEKMKWTRSAYRVYWLAFIFFRAKRSTAQARFRNIDIENRFTVTDRCCRDKFRRNQRSRLFRHHKYIAREIYVHARMYNRTCAD